MDALTVTYTYYDNLDALKYLIDYHEKASIDGITYQVIDDGSQVRPLSLIDIPSTWRLTRITEDIGWNAEGARNLAMHITDTEWNALTDMDTPIMNEGLVKIMDMDLDPNKGYQPRRWPDGKFKNSWVITKDLYNRAGGYDETFTGLYGYDFTFKPAMRKAGGEWAELEDVFMFTIGGGSGGAWKNRDTKRRSNEEYRELVEKLANGEAEYTDERLRFPWQTLR